jgi:short-subunit dehydrogenase
MAVYFATKAYVLSFTEALHEELKPHGVRVSCLCPGPTRTEFGEVAGFRGSGTFDRVAMDAPAVVAAGLRGLDRNRAVVVPGLVNKAVAASTRFAPRSVVRRIAGAIKY